MLNWKNYDRFSYLYSLKTIGHLNLNCEYLVGIHVLQVLRFVYKVQDFGNFELSPMESKIEIK